MKKKLFLIIAIVVMILAFSGIAYAAFTSGTSFEKEMQMPLK